MKYAAHHCTIVQRENHFGNFVRIQPGREAPALRRAGDQVRHSVGLCFRNITHHFRDSRIPARLRKQIDHESGNDLRRMFAAMRSEEDLHRLEERRRLPGALDQIGNVLLMFGRERRDHLLLVLEVAIDKSDANPGLGADIVHAGLVKAALCEAEHGRLKNLLSAIKDGAGAFRGHWK